MEPGKKCQNHGEKTFRTHQVRLCIRRYHVLLVITSASNRLESFNVTSSNVMILVLRNKDVVVVDLMLS